MSELRELDVSPAKAGARLDLFLGEALGLSRAKLKRLFDEGAVRVGGRPAKKGQTLQGGERVRVELPDEAPALVAEPERAPLVVLHEDAGRGGGGQALGDAQPAAASRGDGHRRQRPGRALSGDGRRGRRSARGRAVPPAGRGDQWRPAGGPHPSRPGRRCGAAFAEQQIDKRYWALVTGPLADEGEIDLPLRHHPRHTDRVEPALDEGPAGRPAQSRFRVLARAGDVSLVEVQILTGVLHQVRAHLSAIGAPLVGDGLYGGRALEGLDALLPARAQSRLPPPRRRTADHRRQSPALPSSPGCSRRTG